MKVSSKNWLDSKMVYFSYPNLLFIFWKHLPLCSLYSQFFFFFLAINVNENVETRSMKNFRRFSRRKTFARIKKVKIQTEIEESLMTFSFYTKWSQNKLMQWLIFFLLTNLCDCPCFVFLSSTFSLK